MLVSFGLRRGLARAGDYNDRDFFTDSDFRMRERRGGRISVIVEGKTVAVCGVGGGLGQEIARVALRDGANVVLGARTQASLEKIAAKLDPSGKRVATVPTDVTQPDQCERFARSARERFGRLDALANVAALDSVFGGIDTPLEEWRRTYETNVFGSVTLVRAAAAEMRKSGGGSVVLIGSQSTFLPQILQAAYASSKGAMISAMFYMAKELGPSKIRVNTVIPTWMWGPPVENYMKGEAQRTGKSVEEVKKGVTVNMPLGEIPADEDVAEAVIFLCSDRARMITGQSLMVNSGELMR
jgi:NAD(P)-dependent dehydrogenase (short-subunit alcohol dehydrogenase family)